MFMFVIGHCVSCGRQISFSPSKVPSIRVNNEGPREPLCRDCAEKLNDIYEENGKPRVPIQDGAYSADPC